MLRIAVAALACALLAGCAGTVPEVERPAELPAAATVLIEAGDTGSDIARALERAQVTDRQQFQDLVSKDPRGRSLRPGDYRLPTGVSAREALELLLGGQAAVNETLVVVPGQSARELAGPLAEVTGASPDTAVEALGLVDGTSALDGYLAAATYDVLPGDTPASLVTRMKQAARPTLDLADELAPQAGMSARDLLTVASILLAEVHEVDWPRAARVIANRLGKGMPLQLDSTAAYGAGVRVLDLSRAQMGNPSPYNTYTRKGLPPGPIGAVTADAVQAAASPAEGTWLYWVTVNPDTGLTRFSSSYEQFLRDKQEYLAWRAAN